MYKQVVFVLFLWLGSVVVSYAEESGYLGILVKAPTNEDRFILELEGDGLLVSMIFPNSPAAKAKIQINDFLTAVDDLKIDSMEGLKGILAKRKPGDKVRVSVKRINADEEWEALSLECVLENAKKASFPLFGEPAPEIMGPGGEKNWINAKPVKLADRKGKVTVVYFFDVCDSAGTAHLEAVTQWQSKYKDKDFLVVGVQSAEDVYNKKQRRNDSERRVDAVKKLDLKFPVVFDVEQVISDVYIQYALPAIYVIDKKGVIRDVSAELSEPRVEHIDPERIESMIGQLLNEEAPTAIHGVKEGEKNSGAPGDDTFPISASFGKDRCK